MDLSGLNRDVTIAQYGTVDIGLKGGFTVDSSTVAFVTDPEGEIKNAIDSLKKGYGDAAKTTEEIYEKSVVLYERTKSLIGDMVKQNIEDKTLKMPTNITMLVEDTGVILIRNPDGTTELYSSNQQRLENEAMNNAKYHFQDTDVGRMVLVEENQDDSLKYKLNILLENHAVVCVQTETILFDSNLIKITKLDGVQLIGDGKGKVTYTLNTDRLEYVNTTTVGQYKLEASSLGDATVSLGNSVPGPNQFGISKEGLLAGIEISEPVSSKGTKVYTNTKVIVKPDGIAAIGAVIMLSNPEIGIPAGAKIIYDATK
jgi:hypothetical protein